MNVSFSSNSRKIPSARSRASTSAHPESNDSPENVADLLTRAARYHPRSGVCLVSAEREGEALLLTYSAVLAEAKRILGGLRASGHPVGANVVLLLERPRDVVPAFWACALGGYIPCPVAPIRNDPERWAKHLSHIDALLDHPLIVSVDALRKQLPAGVKSLDLDAARAAKPFEQIHAARPESPAVFMLTSGSTGNSKAVMLTHANLLASMAGKAKRQRLTAEDVTLNWIAFDHVAALLEMHLVSLYAGAVQLHIEPAAILADPLLFLRLIDRYRVSGTFCPNFLFGQINAALKTVQSQNSAPLPFNLDLSCLRFIISGGEANVVETGRQFLDLLAPYGLTRDVIRPAFGMTETSAGSVYSTRFPDGDVGQEFASVGEPIAGMQMRIVDDHQIPVRPGESGELQLSGAVIFPAYYNNRDATKAAFTADGWFRTGDLGRIEDGRLTLVGRSKDSIIVSGVNYFSHELEAVLEQLDGIERSFVAVFPIRPKGADTEQLAVLFATTYSLEDEARLYQLIIAVRNTTIMLWGFRPSIILPIPKAAFPKTSLGKTQRSLLRSRLEAGELRARQEFIAGVTSRQLGQYVAPEGPRERAVANIYAQLFGLVPSTVGANTSFFDLGGTSLDIIKLKQKLEDHMGVSDLPIIQVLQNPTVRALASKRTGEYDPLIPLQLTGNKTPIFCVHPGTGEVLVYVGLANYFVNERPFYALRARGLDMGEKHFESFGEMVDIYVKAIRGRQPHGPYAIAGYSFGGPVAVEIAKVLEAQGEQVAFIATMDGAPYIRGPRGRLLDEVDSAIIVAFFLSLIDKKQMDELPDRLRAAPIDDVCSQIIQLSSPERLIELDLDFPKFRAWAALAYTLVRIGQAYVPSGKVQTLTVFYADPLWGTKQEWLTHQLKKWDEFTRSPNRYIEVAGEHNTLIGPKHVSTFQAVLRTELDRALGGK